MNNPKFYLLIDNKDEKAYIFQCPGCQCNHYVKVKGPAPVWRFNDDLVKPTVSPSIKVLATVMSDEAHEIMERCIKYKTPVPDNLPKKNVVCHSLINKGMIQFLGDCSHDLAGRTVEIPDWI